MLTAVKTGWLKDKNKEKFAPKTIASQVIKNDGTPIDNNLLPDVTAEDNDKFLKVVNGEWTAVAIPPAEGVSY